MWNKKQVLESFLIFYKKNKRPPKANECCKANNLPSYRTILKFGGIIKLCNNINVEPNRKYLTIDEIQDSFIFFYKKYNRLPRSKELGTKRLPSSNTVGRYGGLLKICEELGIKVKEKKHTKDSLIKDMIKYCKKYNLEYLPTARTMNNSDELASYSIYVNRIGKISVIAKECNLKYKKRTTNFSIPINSKKYGIFDSTIEYTIFCVLLNYFKEKEIIRQATYNELFNTKTKHTCDFYIPKLDIIIEVTSEDNNIPKYIITKQWKLSISDNIHFIYSVEDIINLMNKLGIKQLCQ